MDRFGSIQVGARLLHVSHRIKLRPNRSRIPREMVRHNQLTGSSRPSNNLLPHRFADQDAIAAVGSLYSFAIRARRSFLRRFALVSRAFIGKRSDRSLRIRPIVAIASVLLLRSASPPPLTPTPPSSLLSLSPFSSVVFVLARWKFRILRGFARQR